MSTKVKLFLLAILALAATPLLARDTDSEAKRAREAASVLTEIMNIPEDGIPEDLMKRAQAVAVIPHVVKGAFGFGGQYGKGLVSQRLSNGKWSAPSYIHIGGGSFGLQIGAQASDLVLVFTNSDGVDPLLRGKVTLGADASVSAGPVGRRAAVATDVLLRSGIFSYSRSKGLFAGVSLDGSSVTIDDSANHDVYGKNVTGENVLSGRVSINKIVKPYIDALEKYTPAKRTS
jgi:lipid-binding SYLF domain-containing protein